MAKERSAGAVIYQIPEGGTVLYLLLQPAVGKPWGFPKGKVDGKETDEQTARREITEEAGLAGLIFDPRFRHIVQYIFRRGRSQVRKQVVYFLARTKSHPEIRLSSEHVAFRWATYDEAMELVVFENTREILRKAADHITTLALASARGVSARSEHS